VNLNGAKRIDFQNHSTLSDGVLEPLALLQRAVQLNFHAIALTEHVDAHNVERMVERLSQVQVRARSLPLIFIPGVEITGVPPDEIAAVARIAKLAGARLVLVHGETLMGGALPGTNLAAAQCPDMDLIGHPGFLTEEAARAARENNIFIELSGREIHSLTNGYLARLAARTGIRLVVDSDAHRPEQMLSMDRAELVARGAGLEEDEIARALVANPAELLARVVKR
jgi:putative hydrolase